MAVWVCTSCGQQASKWLGRCPSCGAFNTFEPQREKPRQAASPPARPEPLKGLSLGELPRLATGLPGLDRVLGGGLVPGSLVLLAGEPGVGKSTLLLQLAERVAQEGPVLYATAEESLAQVGLRAQRLGCQGENLLLLAEANVEAVLAAAEKLKPRLLLLDSVQAMRCEGLPAIPGSVTQVREVAARVAEAAKTGQAPVVLVGHVTKDGTVAGPKSLEHLVDVVLEFAPATSHAHRLLRATKNRFGPALELCLFAMGEKGLHEVLNPSQALLGDRLAGAPGSAVAVVVEGSTPLLLEIQALVSRSPLLNPRRVGQGFEASRLSLLLAVMEKRLHLRLADRDVFVNVVGGLQVEEPAADLAVVAAVLSSYQDRPLPAEAVFFGEVGLLGEVRAVSRADARLREAQTLGFQKAFVGGKAILDGPSPLALVQVPHLQALAQELAMLHWHRDER